MSMGSNERKRIKAISLDSSWLAESVHPAVHRHNFVVLLISQAGMSDSISGSFAENGQLLHSKAVRVLLNTILERGKAFAGGYYAEGRCNLSKLALQTNLTVTSQECSSLPRLDSVL